MSDERAEFSKRLAAAMQSAGYEARPSVLFRQFNARYRGRSVVFQTASRWLNGGSIPEQDKLQVLAEMYNVEPHALRFGDGKRAKVVEMRAAWPGTVGAIDRAAFDGYLALPASKRRLVRELISALSR